MPNLGQKVQALANNGLELIKKMETEPLLIPDFTQTTQYKAIKEEFQDAVYEGHKLYNK